MSMCLSKLFAGLVDDVSSLAVSDITTDSRRVVPGALFIACRGEGGHGLEFLSQALEAGATAVAWEPEAGLAEPEIPEGIVSFSVEGLGDYVGMLANRYFSQPSVAVSIAGITGTNGKTTTAWLVAGAMDHLGLAAGYMGTLGYGRISSELETSALTTPGVISVHRRLREMADAGASHVVMEVSSHGLDQSRIAGVQFKTVAFTNLTRDHLDYHGDMKAYQQAKLRLFTEFEFESAVVHVANDFGRELAGLLHKDVHLLTVSTDSEISADLQLELLAASAEGLHIRFCYESRKAELKSPLWGRFNVENLAVAAGILIAEGVSLDDAVAALANCKAPAGRMELIAGDASQPLVIVDFAHTPDALDQALTTVRDHCEGDIWCVFGCGGNRDQGKRSQMAAVASQRASFTIVTDDNPRDEDPEKIVADVLSGFLAAHQPQIIHDRDMAIHTAVKSANAGDVVFIAGKGDESYQIKQGEFCEFSDRDAAMRALGKVA
ncbi:MAG: UDP-N-acetylmuramoyl-L-alanyl-D-glutamate--2,6-diaminopimelate ligase [Gammaproteobacteria bacterium]|nr:UDP-N-acetylmuramoyl-L-alanyl-D-glutamate--2,6-diaminopimelate ligase [Gammaproteobacteria bacterium]